MSDYIPLFYVDVITYPCSNLSTCSVKGAPDDDLMMPHYISWYWVILEVAFKSILLSLNAIRKGWYIWNIYYDILPWRLTAFGELISVVLLNRVFVLFMLFLFFCSHVTQVTTWCHPLSKMQHTKPKATPKARPPGQRSKTPTQPAAKT